jgi:hypothetical protein
MERNDVNIDEINQDILFEQYQEFDLYCHKQNCKFFSDDTTMERCLACEHSYITINGKYYKTGEYK